MKKLSKEPPVLIPDSDSPSSESEETKVYVQTPEAVASLNVCLTPYNDQMMTLLQLFHWASTNVPSVHFGYCSMEDYEIEQHNLEQRFHLQSHMIPGTKKLHSFVPISKSKVRVSFYSASDTSKEETITKE